MIQRRPINRYKVEAMRTKAVSIVQKGAAENSDAYLLQQVPQLVPDAPEAEGTVEYPIVDLVQEHLGALEGDDLTKATAAIVDVLEQGAVAEALAATRASWPSYQLWDTFTCVYGSAATAEEKREAILDFGQVLLTELMGGDADGGTVTQEAPAEGETETPAAETTSEGEAAVTQEIPVDAATEGEESSDAGEQPLTQAAVEQLVIQALEPVRAAVDAVTKRAETAEAALEQAKTENALLKSKTTPQSRQPDVEAAGTATVAQSDPTPDPYAGSHLSAWLTQHFPSR